MTIGFLFVPGMREGETHGGWWGGSVGPACPRVVSPVTEPGVVPGRCAGASCRGVVPEVGRVGP